MGGSADDPARAQLPGDQDLVPALAPVELDVPRVDQGEPEGDLAVGGLADGDLATSREALPLAAGEPAVGSRWLGRGSRIGSGRAGGVAAGELLALDACLGPGSRMGSGSALALDVGEGLPVPLAGDPLCCGSCSYGGV